VRLDPTARRELHRRIEAEALPVSIGHHLDAVAMNASDRPAWITIDSEGPTRTYRELAADASEVANAFRSLGVVKGEHVGVMLPNGLAFLAAWLGLAKLGAVLVPLNSNITSNELQHILEDGNVGRALVNADSLVLFRSTDVGSRLVESGRVTLSNDADKRSSWETLVKMSCSAFEYPDTVELDDPVSIIYTSGSTGRPKGCVLTHRYWLTLGKVKASLLPPCERIMCELPFYYMSPYYRFSVASFQAAAICVPPGPSISRFYKRVVENMIDVAWIGDPIATLPYPRELGPHKLKQVLLYGLKSELHRPLERRLGVPARESFGMTEIGPGLYMPIEDVEMSGSGSCGIPTPFRECMVGDEQGTPVAVGEVGELLIAGPGLFSGYYGDPEMTARSFWGKWFRTGDLARQDEHGYFYIVGRIKEMIKRSSENIAAQEVESAIYALPQILEVAVIGVPDEKRGEEVKACVVLQSGATVESLPPTALTEHCRARLANFKVPRYIQYYKELPKTSSQKIAKRLLADGAGIPLTSTFDMRGPTQ
jgi:acyl-CoA synthetase (AMP-forming)/AMP-acid ligase II